MWSWFGGQSAQKRKEAPKEAILGLRGQLEMLQKRQTHLETQIADQESIARKNVTSNKNVAKAALRRKKMHEKNLEQTQNQIIQLEQHVYSIEAANINQETLSAMDQAGKAMQRMHDGLTMDKVDNMMYVFFYKKKAS
jgi:charged multivesicular body protein 4